MPPIRQLPANTLTSVSGQQIAESKGYAQVYIATHKTLTYHLAQQVRDEEFWGVKAWTFPPRKPLKDPDVVIAQGEQVKFLVEVKWGAVQGSTKTDLLLSPQEWGKMARLLDGSAICRVRGPAVKDSRCYHSPLPLRGDYSINDNTKLVLVSDFRLVKELIGAKLEKFLRQWKSANVDIQLADIDTGIKTGVDEIKILSFQEVMEAQWRTSPNIRSGN